MHLLNHIQWNKKREEKNEKEFKKWKSREVQTGQFAVVKFYCLVVIIIYVRVYGAVHDSKLTSPPNLEAEHDVSWRDVAKYVLLFLLRLFDAKAGPIHLRQNNLRRAVSLEASRSPKAIMNDNDDDGWGWWWIARLFVISISTLMDPSVGILWKNEEKSS